MSVQAGCDKRLGAVRKEVAAVGHGQPPPGARCGNGRSESGSVLPMERDLVMEAPLNARGVVGSLDVADETSVFL